MKPVDTIPEPFGTIPLEEFFMNPLFLPEDSHVLHSERAGAEVYQVVQTFKRTDLSDVYDHEGVFVRHARVIFIERRIKNGLAWLDYSVRTETEGPLAHKASLAMLRLLDPIRKDALASNEQARLARTWRNNCMEKGTGRPPALAPGVVVRTTVDQTLETGRVIPEGTKMELKMVAHRDDVRLAGVTQDGIQIRARDLCWYAEIVDEPRFL